MREAEVRLHKAEEWENKPKPRTDAQPPTDIENLADVVGRTRLLYDMIHLALAERLHADRHAEPAVVRAGPAGGGRHARDITTCRITARTPARSPSSR